MIKTADVIANRKRFLQALINEPQDAQCNASLFEYGDLASDGKEKRCALGVAASLFLGVTTYEEAEEYERTHDENGLYNAIVDILGLDSAQDIWGLNDSERLTFDEIAETLGEDWKVAA